MNYTKYVVALVADTLFNASDYQYFGNTLPGIIDSLRVHMKDVGNAARSFEDAYSEFNDLREARSAPISQRRERYAAIAESFAGAVAELAKFGTAFIKVDSLDGRGFVIVMQSASTMASALVEREYVTASSLGLAVLRTAGYAPSDAIVRWTTFAGGLATAKDPADVTAVLEQFALPPASYLGKRYPASYNERTRTPVHINSYMGFSGGGEWLNRHPNDPGRPLSTYVGMTLPVGVELGLTSVFDGIASLFGVKNTGENPTSLFVSVLDLGAVASYRIGDSGSESPPNVTFANVIAPGIFLTTGLGRNWPLALGTGWQYAPRLRNLKSGERRDASRVGVFLAADIPLFRLR